jgi:hypothetical protein
VPAFKYLSISQFQERLAAVAVDKICAIITDFLSGYLNFGH